MDHLEQAEESYAAAIKIDEFEHAKTYALCSLAASAIATAKSLAEIAGSLDNIQAYLSPEYRSK